LTDLDLDLNKLIGTFDDGVQEGLVSLFWFGVFEVVIDLIRATFGIAMQQLVQVPLTAIFADYIGLPSPNNEVEDPIQKDGDDAAEGEIVDIVLKTNDQLVVNEKDNNAEAVDEVRCTHPLGLEGPSAGKVDDHRNGKDEDDIIQYFVDDE
jgi:hypothetical protein